MITVTARARCIQHAYLPACDWTAAGDWPAVDKAAERHTQQAKHATATLARPATAAGSTTAPAFMAAWR